MQDFIKKYRSILTFFGGLAVIAVIAFAFFYPDASEGNQLRQHDMQQGIAIGQEAKVYAEQTGEVSRWTNSLFPACLLFRFLRPIPQAVSTSGLIV